MTVGELIYNLSMYPRDRRVITPILEFGYGDIKAVEHGRVRLDVNKKSYAGPHDDAETGDASAIDVVILR